MEFDQSQIILLLIVIIFFETGIILGQWLNHLAEANEVRAVKISNRIKKVFIFIFAVGTFLIVSYLLIVSVFPKESINISIGILSGFVSGGLIIFLQDFLYDK